MPLYIYKNTETEEHIEVMQGMNDVHEYHGENGDEDCWVRVFTIPNASIDTKIDPFNKNTFIRNTENKNDSMGDMWDRSKELSEIRKDKVGGIDPVQEKALDNYAKERNGREHPMRKKQKLKENLDKKGINLEY